MDDDATRLSFARLVSGFVANAHARLNAMVPPYMTANMFYTAQVIPRWAWVRLKCNTTHTHRQQLTKKQFHAVPITRAICEFVSV